MSPSPRGSFGGRERSTLRNCREFPSRATPSPLGEFVKGLTNKDIAKTLQISHDTVKEHDQHIIRKIGVADRTQAAVWAVRKGLV